MAAWTGGACTVQPQQGKTLRAFSRVLTEWKSWKAVNMDMGLRAFAAG
jgi:hypothetical protein